MKKYILRGIYPQKNGEIAKIQIDVINQADTQKQVFCVSADMLFSLGIQNGGLLELSEEKYFDIQYHSEVFSAASRALKMLAISDNTAKMLKRKLVLKGIDKDIAACAVEYLVSIGILKENSFAENYFRNCANTKLYGALRIKKEMYEKGFSDEAIKYAQAQNDIDFVEICKKRIQKTRITLPFLSLDDKKKAFSSLTRYGFLYDEILQAFDMLSEK